MYIYIYIHIHCLIDYNIVNPIYGELVFFPCPSALRIICWFTPLGSRECSLDSLGFPSGKLSDNYGKIHHFYRENSRFLSTAMASIA